MIPAEDRDASLAGLFFFAVAAVLHLEVLKDPEGLVLAGKQVGGFFAWLFWWWRFAFEEGLPLFHSGLLMYPAGVPTFPHSPVNEVPAVLLQSLISPFEVTNLLLIASYPLTGLTAFVLLRRITRDPWASVCGAFAYAFSGYMLVQHFHGQVIEATLFFNPLLVLTFDQLLERPGRGAALRFAGALLGVLLSGPYVGFCFGVVFLGLFVLYDLGFGHRLLLRKHAWRWAAGAAAAAGAVAVVCYWPLLRLGGNWAGSTFFYSLSLAAFFDLPFWHSSGAVQSLRLLGGSGARPEEVMAWLGAVPLALLAAGMAREDLRRDPVWRFWTFILGAAAVLCLGPELKLTPRSETGLPLPYAVFQALPLLGAFRNPGRILMTVTLASAVLTALALARLTERVRPALKAAGAAAFIALWTLEFDLPRAGAVHVSTEPPPVYDAVLAERGDFALLELPSSYDRNGNLYIHGQYYMLMQVRHERPIVLGYPSRYSRESLAFTESTDYVYELTHPWALERLDNDPALQQRARWLKGEGRRILAAKGIRFVIWHEDLPAYDADTRARIKAWLDAALGKPETVDEHGNRLYRTGRG